MATTTDSSINATSSQAIATRASMLKIILRDPQQKATRAAIGARCLQDGGPMLASQWESACDVFGVLGAIKRFG